MVDVDRMGPYASQSKSAMTTLPKTPKTPKTPKRNKSAKLDGVLTSTRSGSTTPSTRASTPFSHRKVSRNLSLEDVLEFPDLGQSAGGSPTLAQPLSSLPPGRDRAISIDEVPPYPQIDGTPCCVPTRSCKQDEAHVNNASSCSGSSMDMPTYDSAMLTKNTFIHYEDCPHAARRRCRSWPPVRKDFLGTGEVPPSPGGLPFESLADSDVSRTEPKAASILDRLRDCPAAEIPSQEFQKKIMGKTRTFEVPCISAMIFTCFTFLVSLKANRVGDKRRECIFKASEGVGSVGVKLLDGPSECFDLMVVIGVHNPSIGTPLVLNKQHNFAAGGPICTLAENVNFPSYVDPTSNKLFVRFHAELCTPSGSSSSSP